MNITPIFIKSKRTSNSLLRDIRRRSSLNRKYEKRTLDLLKKSIEERSKTYAALSKRDKEGGGIFGSLFGGFGGSLLLNRLRGRGKGGSGGMGFSGVRPRKPILPKGGGAIGKNLGRFGKFGRVGPLAIIGTGLDFSGRLGSGQNIAQATIGAGGGLAGALAGGAKGAAIGTAFGGPLGTLIGGIIGSGVGAFAGGGIADLLTGVNADRVRKSQILIERKRREKTLFSGALDQFDDTLKTFEEDTAPTLIAYKKQTDDDDDRTGKIPSSIIKPSTPFFQRPAVRAIGLTLLAAGATVAAIKVAPVLIALGAKAKILIPAFKSAAAKKGFSKLPLEKQLQAIAKEIGRTKLLERVSKAFDKNKTKIRTGQRGAKKRRITKESQKAKIEKIFEKRDPQMEKLINKAKKDTDAKERFMRDTGMQPDRDPERFLEQAEIIAGAARDTLQKRIPGFFKTGKIRNMGSDIGAIKNFNQQISGKLRDFIKLRNAFIEQKFKVPRNQQLLRRKLDDQIDGIQKAINFLEDILDNITQLDPKFNPNFKKELPDILEKLSPFLKKSGNKLGSLEPESDDTNIAFDPFANEVISDLGAEIGDELALAPKEDTFSNSILESITESQQSETIMNDSDNNLIVMNNPTTIRPMSLGGGGQRTVVIKNESFDAVAKYAQMTGLLTV